MHAPWQVSSPLCLGNGASPRGPKFGISILRGNGPPFAACHHKIGGFVLARDPPAERGAPLFPLCSMTPLVLTVDFLSLPSLSWPRSPSSYSVSSLLFRRKKNQQTTTTSEKVHLVILRHQTGISFLSFFLHVNES